MYAMTCRSSAEPSNNIHMNIKKGMIADGHAFLTVHAVTDSYCQEMDWRISSAVALPVSISSFR